MFTDTVATTDRASNHESQPGSSFDRQVMTVKEFQQAFGVSESYVYKLMGNGDVEYRKMGRKRAIVIESAKAWFANLPGNKRAA